MEMLPSISVFHQHFLDISMISEAGIGRKLKSRYRTDIITAKPYMSAISKEDLLDFANTYEDIVASFL